MASASHVNVDRGQANSNVYSDNAEHFGYGPMFQSSSSAGQNYNQNWPLDPNLNSTSTRDAPYADARAWNHNQSPQPQQQQQHQRQHPSSNAPSFSANNNTHPVSLNPTSIGYHNIASGYTNSSHYQAYSEASLDPSFTAPGAQPNNAFRQDQQYYPVTAQSTVAPAVLQNSLVENRPTASEGGRPAQFTSANLSQATSAEIRQSGTRSIPPGFVLVGAQGIQPPVLTVSLPKGVKDGAFLIVNQNELANATQSVKLTDFCNVGIEPREFNTIKIGNTPVFYLRRSRNDFKAAAADDPKLLSKLSKKQSRVFKSKGPKIPRPRLPLSRAGSQSQVSTPSSVDTSSSEDESDYSASDDELDIVETAPIPESRPSEPLKATSYDTVRAVWLPRKVHPSSDQIRKGLKDVWEVLSTLRDRWKSDGDALKTATEKKKEKELSMLKERVKSQRAMLQMALSAALDHGHPEILSRMGEIKPFLQMCNIFLVDRARESDFDGTLPNHLLELLAKCTSVTPELLEQYKLKKTLGIFTKRGNETTKSLAKRIEENAVKASKAQADKAKESKDLPIEIKDKEIQSKVEASTTGPTTTPDPVVGAKRPRPAEGAGTQPNKRVASGTTASTGTLKVASTITKRSPSGGAEKIAAGSKVIPSVAAKAKAAIPAKPPSLFAGLQSAGKKPGTSNAALAANKKLTPASGDKKPVTTTSSTTVKSSSGFNFGEYMADLNKPKDPEPSKNVKKDDRPPETEAQKAKRLRKESRRHLRVSFKEGPALLEVRLFHHDPEEETGHDANMVRDVGNVGLEGRMFKQHKDQIDLDEDEEDDEKLVEFKFPSAIDFSTMPEEAKAGESCNYAKFGGAKQPDSPEKTVQEKHESDTLFVYYSDSSEIPLCPREPSDPYTGGNSTESVDFGMPNELVKGRSAALTPQQTMQTTALPGTTDVSALLEAIGAMQGQPAVQPATGDPFAALQALMPKQTAPAAIQPPIHEQLDSQTGANLASVLASLSAHTPSASASAPQTQSQVPQMAGMPSIPPMPMPPLPGVVQGQMPDLNQMMALFAQAGGMPSMPAIPGFAPPMQQQNSSDGNAANSFENPERLKRMREADDEPSDQPPTQKWGNNKKKQWVGERPKFVKPCMFWQQGRCLKGAECTFLHET